jgi:hypothetical protein
VGFVYALKTERSFGFTPRFSASRALWCVCVCVWNIPYHIALLLPSSTFLFHGL